MTASERIDSSFMIRVLDGALWCLVFIGSMATSAQGDEVAIHKPVLFLVQPGVASEQSRDLDIPLDEALRDFFGANQKTLDWDIDPFIDDMSLDCPLTSNRIPVGAEKSGKPFEITRTTGAIKHDRPGRMTFTLKQSRSLKPGVYSGSVSATFRCSPPNACNTIFRIRWPISVTVPGRILRSVEFLNARSGIIRFGDSSDVRIVVDTIGCDLGEGHVRIFQGGISGHEKTWFAHSVPFSDLRDPLTDFPENPDPKKQVTYLQDWQDIILHTQTSVTSIPAPRLGQVRDARRHEITLNIGPCLDVVPNLTVTVNWPEYGPEEKAVAPLPPVSSTVRVEPGILAFPKVALMNEDVLIRAITREAPARAIMVELETPSREKQDLWLTLATSSDSEEIPKADYYTYEGSYTVDGFGTYKLRWPNQPTTIPTEFHSCGLVKKVAAPLRVFLGTTFTFPWMDEFEGNPLREVRTNAFQLALDDAFFTGGEMTIRPIGLYRTTTNERGQIVGREPFKMPSADLLIDVSPSQFRTVDAATGWALGTPKARTASDSTSESEATLYPNPASIKLQKSEIASFDIWSSVEPLERMENPEPKYGYYSFTARFQLSGHLKGDDGKQIPISRIVEIPFEIEITDFWRRNRDGVILVATTSVSAFLGSGYWFIKRRRKRREQQLRQNIS